MEWPFRRALASIYTGSTFVDPLDGRGYSRFIEIKRNDFVDWLSPGTASLSRTRFLYLLFQQKFKNRAGLRVLHFSPQRYLRKKFRGDSGIEYWDSNYEDQSCSHQFDIQNIAAPSDHFDVVICYHVFEHIPNDRKGMGEVFRVLKKGGILLSQVPWRDGETLEDSSVKDPKKRLETFGQEDHVRFYGQEDFVERLENIGFYCESISPADLLSDEAIQKHCLNSNEQVILSTK